MIIIEKTFHGILYRIPDKCMCQCGACRYRYLFLLLVFVVADVALMISRMTAHIMQGHSG